MSDETQTKMENFFRQNPNIKTFSSNIPINATNWLLKSGIKFDDLVLEIKRKMDLNVDQIIENVHYLHKNQQIKRLHLQIFDKEFLLNSKFVTLKFLESIKVEICLGNDDIFDSIISLPNLNFLIFHKNRDLFKHHSKRLAQKLNKLEEFHTDAFVSITDIIPFVRYSSKLNCIFICDSINCNILKNATIQQLDKERRRLENACKLKIYMKEEHYLHVKKKSLTSSYGLVEIKRSTSYPMSKHPLRPQCY